jgi:hypothetical protein
MRGRQKAKKTASQRQAQKRGTRGRLIDWTGEQNSIFFCYYNSASPE